jgi:glutathione S-transferase
MTKAIKPITVYGTGPSANPLKVAIILEELSIPYTVDPIPWSDIKKPAYLAINPNGRLPAIQDPNTNISLWESGAIIEYLVEKYDTEHKLSFAAGTVEYFHAKQWLYFQTSGQGPYFGQLGWFKLFSPEQITLAIDRYAKEVARVTGVLEGWLEKQESKTDGPWLVGGRISYADLSFVTWYNVIAITCKEEFDLDASEFPRMKEWIGRMKARNSVRAVLETGS